ncbi:hypothetical protein RSW25_25830, partial [Escherichia coli]
MRRRVRGDHVQRLSGSDSQAAPLAHGEAMHSRVLAEPRPLRRDDLTARLGIVYALLAQVAREKRGVVAVR